MTILEAIILGLIQGLTEFLPVSSSGHLVLGEYLLNIRPNNDVTFEVFVHFGTLLSVVVVFWKDVVGVVQAFVRAFVPFRLNREYYREHEHFRLAVAILIGSVPAAYVGLRFEDEISQAFADPKLVAVMLVVTGLILFLTGLAKPVEGKRVGLVSSFLIGCAQAMAIIPGISRSGSTISAAMYLKVEPFQAARFSFLMSLPVIAGATLLKTKDLLTGEGSSEGLLVLLVGTLVAFGSGYVAIKFLLKIIERGNIRWFSVYCLLVGILGIIFI
ncbi:MAG: undecaprenyl-diphosphate phosphatase [Ignavibacteriae bacterium]|nr:undecaprenyl-diphosphate phosphatase [Ignavibacteriota bacterium]